jgi:hypothetical protein
VRTLLFLLASVVSATAQSHPGWWTFVAPDSKTLVGIHWQAIQDSSLGEHLRLHFIEPGPPFNPVAPNMPCLLQARDLLISSPELVMGASGGCTAAELKSQATERGWKHSGYKGFDMWAAPDSNVLQWSERVVLVGAAHDLRAVVDRSLEEKREYSPLLMTGAKLARENDFWVVSTEAKEEAASAYAAYAIAPESGDAVAGETIGTSIALQAESVKRAIEIAAAIRRVNPSAQVSASGTTVTATARLAKGHPALPAAVMDRIVAGAFPITAGPVAAVAPGPSTTPSTAPSTGGALEPGGTARESAKPPTPPERQVIRIFGLDEGTREILLPPKQPLQ